MPKGPKAEVRFLGEGSKPSAHQLGVLRERCKLAPGRAPTEIGFGAFLPKKNLAPGDYK